jgi:hypothetical protein
VTYHDAWRAFDQREISEVDDDLGQSKAGYATDLQDFIEAIRKVGRV